MSLGPLDPGILCIQHCGAKIFSFNVPEKCPLCNSKILDEKSNFGIMPFRLPYPFVRASQTQAAVILRPTHGDFLNDYNNSTDLHTALTTSEGVIVEFDSRGLRRHETKNCKKTWEQCLVLESVPEAWWDYWDEMLLKVSSQSLWTPSSYHQDNHNCYSFVLTFLQELGYGDLSRVAANKTLFCERFICPKTVIAGKYISLYRKLRDQGHYIHKSPAKNATEKTSESNTSSKTKNTTSHKANFVSRN